MKFLIKPVKQKMLSYAEACFCARCSGLTICPTKS